MGQGLGPGFDFSPGIKAIFALGIAGLTAYVGIRTGIDGKGSMKYMGWIVGVIGGLTALLSAGELLALTMAQNKPEPQQTAEVPKPTQQPQGIPTR